VMGRTNLHPMHYPVVGLGGCVITAYLVSLLLPQPQPRDLPGLTSHTTDKQT
ncbi:MAG: hypothetical protein GY794_16700, partial [bacterium]|nr:hypothetical protein [bacterium]